MNNTIALSDTTLKLLRNLSTINKGLLFTKDGLLSSINETDTVQCSVKVEEKIPVEFAVYNLKNLLDTLDEKPKIMARVIVGIYIINSSCLKSIKKDYLDMPDFIKFLIKKKKRVGYYPIFEKFNHITKKSDLK